MVLGERQVANMKGEATSAAVGRLPETEDTEQLSLSPPYVTELHAGLDWELPASRPTSTSAGLVPTTLSSAAMPTMAPTSFGQGGAQQTAARTQGGSGYYSSPKRGPAHLSGRDLNEMKRKHAKRTRVEDEDEGEDDIGNLLDLSSSSHEGPRDIEAPSRSSHEGPPTRSADLKDLNMTQELMTQQFGSMNLEQGSRRGLLLHSDDLGLGAVKSARKRELDQNRIDEETRAKKP
jgi:hypothetical protein